MMLANMFKKTTKLEVEAQEKKREEKPEVPNGLVRKCNMCKKTIFTDAVKANHYICPECGGYFRLDAYRRIEMLVNQDSFESWDEGLQTSNPLHDTGYPQKVKNLQQLTGLDEAVITGKAVIGAQPVVLAVMDGRFLMASMGAVVGEKITRAVERATKLQLPVVIFTCSGGARMQEGICSLMQMAKTSAALKKHSDAGLLYISVLTDPTTGGVTASFAMLADIILAEPKALIGFAGPRVIEQTIGEKLPKGFQKSEFLLEHGFIDRIVSRTEMRTELEYLLRLHASKQHHTLENIESRESIAHRLGNGCIEKEPSANIKIQKKNIQKGTRYSHGTQNTWEKVLRSRMKTRPVGSQYMEELLEGFIELHGDRYYRDDPAIQGGIGYLKDMPVTIIAQCKGITTKENIRHRFGMPSPEGYRKALRLMKQAEKFGRPILCLVDTPGAFCGVEAEERGQGEAIARNLFEMSSLTVPILSIVIGEGGSGGALALAVSDEVWMLENSVYSILSPEGYSTILWKDSARAQEAAELMRMTAYELLEDGFIEKVIQEPSDYCNDTLKEMCITLQVHIKQFFTMQKEKNTNTLVGERYNRFRQM